MLMIDKNGQNKGFGGLSARQGGCQEPGRVLYRYKAVNRLTCRIVGGVLSAAGENDLTKRLEGMNFDLIHSKKLSASHTLWNRLFPLRAQRRDVIQLFVMLSRLTHAGLPILTALDKLAANAPDMTLKNVLFQIAGDLTEGMSLSEAMMLYPGIFPRTVANLVAAREQTGDLPAAFDQCATHLKWVDQMYRRTKKALGYPMFLGVVLIVMVTVMMVKVVPAVVKFVTAMGEDISPVTRSLITASHFFIENAAIVAAGAIAAWCGVIVLRTLSQRITYRVDKILLDLPWFGQLAVNLDAVRFLQTFVVLYENGVTILESFNRATYTVNNLAVRRAFRQAMDEVTSGETISQALMRTGMLSDTTIEMIHVGEESGQFGEILTEIVTFYNTDIDDQIDRLIGLIEPAITIIMAGMILWIAAGVFGPIYQSLGEMAF